MVAAHEPGTLEGVIEVSGPHGVRQVVAELVRDSTGAVLRAPRHTVETVETDVPVETVPVGIEQRREYVRAPVRLAVRGMVLPDGVEMLSQIDDGEAELSGHSSGLSGAGLALHWDHDGSSCAPSVAPAPGRRLYLELSMPTGHQRRGALVQTVAEVVASGPDGVQVRFVDLAPIDRERLIALVFQVQRRELARRDSR
jgi:hypothetical protein